MVEKKWYFKFDPTTKEYIPGAVYSEEQPDNSTTVDPSTSEYIDAKWDGSAWTGTVTHEQWARQQQENNINPVDQTQQQIAQLAVQVMQDNAKLTARVKALEAKEANNV